MIDSRRVVWFSGFLTMSLLIGMVALAQRPAQRVPLPERAIVTQVSESLLAGTALPTLPTRYQAALAFFLESYDGARREGPDTEQQLLDVVAAWIKHRLKAIE